MPVSKKNKKYVLRHYPQKSLQQISRELNLPERELEKIIQESGLAGPKIAKSRGPAKPRKRLLLGISALIFALSIIVYSRGIENGFFSDDKYLVLQNRAVRGSRPFSDLFTRELWSPAGKQSNYYRPIVGLSYWLDYRLYQERPAGYHFSNILLHSLVSVLLFWTFFRFTKNPWIGAATGLLFALHPAHTQSVCWISGRTDLLCALFSILALNLYLRTQERKNLGAYILSLLGFSLALFSKEIAVTVPALIILADFATERKLKALFQPRRLGLYAGFAGVMIIYFLIRLKVLGLALGYEGATANDWYFQGQADVSRFATVFKIYFYYLKTVIYPINLCFECKLMPSPSWLDAQVIAGIISVLLILILSALARERFPELGLGLLWFLLTLLPVSNLRPFHEIAMEHFLYLPSIGFCLLLAALLNQIRENKFRQFRNAVQILLITILALFALLTWSRPAVWKNEKAVWKDAVLKAPFKNRGLDGLANELYAQNQMTNAIKYWQLALESNPQALKTRNNLGIAFLTRADYESAIREFKQVLELNPNYPPALNALGAAYLKKGDPESALPELSKCVQLDPNYSDAHRHLGYALELTGDAQAALKEYQAALAADPANLKALQLLARLYLELSRCQDARQALNQLGADAPSQVRQAFEQKCLK